MRFPLIGERGSEQFQPEPGVVISNEKFDEARSKAANRVIHPAEDDPFPLSTQECSEALGIPRQTLKVWIDEGVFKQGECWIRKTPKRTSARWWNPEACRVALQIWNQANATEVYEEVG